LVTKVLVVGGTTLAWVLNTKTHKWWLVTKVLVVGGSTLASSICSCFTACQTTH